MVKENTWFQNRHSKRCDRLHPYIILLPALLLLVLMMYPFFLGIYYSLTNYRLSIPGYRLIWLGNYLQLFRNSDFWHSLQVTLLYAFMAVGCELLLGLFGAVLLDRKMVGIQFFRSILVIPLLVPPVVSAMMWKTILHPTQGVMNFLLNKVGFSSLTWLGDMRTALPSLILIDVWSFTPFVAIVLLAGLQSIPNDIVEAAEVDGASSYQSFFLVKLPLLVPFVLLTILFRVIDSLKMFDLIYSTTRGGPGTSTMTLHVSAYRNAMMWTDIGTAMSLLMILWAICFAFSNFLVKRWVRL